MKFLYNNKEIINGTNLTPFQARLEPTVEYNTNPNKFYTLIMYDPDAVVGNYLHWVVINIPGNSISNGNQVFNYKGPAPPPGSGIHRYIFLVFEQAGIINAPSIPESKRAMSFDTLYGLLNTELHLHSTAYFTSENYNRGGRKRKRNDKSSKTKKRKVRRKKGTINR